MHHTCCSIFFAPFFYISLSFPTTSMSCSNPSLYKCYYYYTNTSSQRQQNILMFIVSIHIAWMKLYQQIHTQSHHRILVLTIWEVDCVCVYMCSCKCWGILSALLLQNVVRDILHSPLVLQQQQQKHRNSSNNNNNCK